MMQSQTQDDLSTEIFRCPWVGSDPLYIRYHDEEWGVPVHDDVKFFELIVLEGFQAGLSWLTILRKRENFRRAFHEFNTEKIARFSEQDINELMKNSGIVRNRMKIEATVMNARQFIKIQENFGSFDDYFWKFTNGATLHASPRPIRIQEIPARSKLSDAISKDMKNRGFKFFGTTICYAHMQACGMVDDHISGCFRIPNLDPASEI